MMLKTTNTLRKVVSHHGEIEDNVNQSAWTSWNDQRIWRRSPICFFVCALVYIGCWIRSYHKP